MVTPHVDPHCRANQLDDLVGTGAVAHHIAQVGGSVIVWSGLQASFQSLKVTVDITYQE